MSTIITDITSIVTAAMGWVGQAVTVITANPLLELAVVLPFVGLGIGLLKRLLSARA